MIKITITEYNFEHDLYSLVRSFYPGEDTTVEIVPLPEGVEPYVSLELEDDTETGSDTCANAGTCSQLQIDLSQEAEPYVSPELEDETESGVRACANTGTCKRLHISLPEAERYGKISRIELKTYVKRKVYEALKERTGRSLAWGTLTGIRPAKLATGLLEEGKADDDIVKYLREHYLVSSQKADLALEVARREKQILDMVDYENGYSLYIGIPFCPTRCLYCSFTSFPLEKWTPRVDEYVDALCKELKFVAGATKGKKLESIYMGGGTPTSLTASQMDRVLTAVEGYFNVRIDVAGSKVCRETPHVSKFGEAGRKGDDRQTCVSDAETAGNKANDKPTYVSVAEVAENKKSSPVSPCEFTVEAGRPDSITRDKLQVIYDHGIRRISVNPQTMQQKTLDLIGRRHTVEDIYRAYDEARGIGFDNINMDLIVGLPGETYEDVEDTMRQIRKMDPDSLTVHSLAIKRAARLNTMREAYANYKITNTQEMIDLTYVTALEMGLHPYYMYRQKNMAGNFENVGYSREGKECIYNILIMEEKQSIIACGAGASTKLVIPEENRIERIENVKDVSQYLERIDEMIERKEHWLCH